MPKVFEDFVVKALRETSALRQLTPNIKNFPQNRPLKFDTKGVDFILTPLLNRQ